MERSKIKLGSLNHVIINNSSDGHLTSEAYLANSRGGTGLNTSTSTGISRVENGTWSVSKLVNNDVDVAAEIERSKIKLGSLNHVIINNSTDGHLTSEAYLSNSRGGTGINSTGLSGIPKVVNGVWSIGSTSSDPNSELGSILDSDISTTAEIKRSKIKLGSLNHVIINNSTDGHLTSEAYLANSRGGSGLDTSSSSGIARVTNGVWSIGYNLVNSDVDATAEIDRSKIKLGSLNHVIINNNTDGHLTSEPQLSITRGGTGLDASGLSGTVKVVNGQYIIDPEFPDPNSIYDSDINSTAEIQRSKIKLGSLNHVIINNSADGHLTSEAQLANSRGGTGLDTSSSSGIARVTNGTWTIGYNVMNADIHATAEVERSKIKLGSLNHVIINNSVDGHLTSEA